MTESDTKQPLPGLYIVMTNRNWQAGEGAVHREDEEARCGRAPTSRSAAHSDLGTAAVLDNPHLCGDCEWPEGAEEVLRS